MEGPEQLLRFLRRLKEVFDVCDQDEDGLVRVEHLLELGVRFGQGDEVKALTRHLEANAHGKINFRDFCHGVLAIKGSEEMQKSAVGVSVNAPSVTDNGYIYQNGEARLRAPVIMCTRPYPECTRGGGAEGGGAEGECEMDSSPDESGGGGERNNTRHKHSRLSASASASVLSEEQFEDYGEGEDVDFSPSSPCPEEENQTSGFTCSASPQVFNSDLLDVYCSQCCKKVNLLNDLEARLRNLKANSPNRKISSTAFGRQLFQANHSVFGSSQASSTEDLFTDSIDSCDLDITDKVSYLEKKVTELESDSLANNDLKSKLKQENTQLVHRVHELEEQMKDSESRCDHSLDEETRRHRELFTKMERDGNQEMDQLHNRLQQLQDQNGEMKLNVNRLKSQTEKLDQEKLRMSDQLEDSSLRLKDETDLYRNILDKLWLNRHAFQKEKESMQELIDDLKREVDHLHIYKLELEHPGKGKALSELNAKTRESEMEQEVKRLKQENYKLRDQNDDLNAQILSLSLYETKNLLCHSKAQCLAAEIDNASKDELVDALKEQEEINLRLRQYMDKIILAILDHNPSILEIKA